MENSPWRREFQKNCIVRKETRLVKLSIALWRTNSILMLSAKQVVLTLTAWEAQDQQALRNILTLSPMWKRLQTNGNIKPAKLIMRFCTVSSSLSRHPVLEAPSQIWEQYTTLGCMVALFFGFCGIKCYQTPVDPFKHTNACWTRTILVKYPGR